jgi:hypothetical protein
MRLASAAIPGRRDPALVRGAPDGAGEPAAHLRPGVRRGARPDRLERLRRYEVHLDRKLERNAHHIDPVAEPAADRRPRLIRLAKLLAARASWRNSLNIDSDMLCDIIRKQT